MQPIPLIAVHAVMILMLSSNRHAPAFPQGTQMSGMPSPPDTIVLTLREAGRLALEREPGLQAERQAVAIARGELRQVRVDGLNPTFEVQQYEAGVAGGARAYTAGLSMDVPWAGQRGLRIAAASAGVERAAATTMSAERVAEATVSLAFFASLAAGRRLQLAEQMAAATQRFFDVTRIQLREGEISALDANLTEIELGRSRGRLLGARREANATLLELRRLIGVPPQTALRLVDGELPSGATLTLNEDSLIAAALLARPDLQASRRQVEQADALRRLAARDWIPTPRLSAFSTRDVGERASRLGLGVALPLPVIDRAQGRVDQEEARLAQSRSRYAALELSIRVEVAEAVRSYLAASDEVTTLESLVLEPARRNLALLDAAYQAGKLALPTVLLVRNQLLDAELDYWRAWQTYRAALVRLHAATGTSISARPDARAPSVPETP